MPQENQPERVECSEETCKSVYFRPQEADEDPVLATSVSTADLAQRHGWTMVDREKGLLHCAWGHPKE